MSPGALAIVPLGVAAGVLTTLAGQGGGLVLLLALAPFVGPHAALGLTTPALFLGNAHRAYLCRAAVDRRLAGLVVLGALPGAYLGGRLASSASPLFLRLALVAVTSLALAKAVGFLKFAVPRVAYAPAGAVIGALAGTSGGAGLLLGPLVYASGLRGPAFVGTVAVTAVALHAGRLVAYGAHGLLTVSSLPLAALLALGIFAGNALADRLRPRLGAHLTTRIELWTLIVCAVLSVVGLV